MYLNTQSLCSHSQDWALAGSPHLLQTACKQTLMLRAFLTVSTAGTNLGFVKPTKTKLTTEPKSPVSFAAE